MIRSGIVKEPLKTPFIFLFIFLCVTLVLTAIQVCATWGLYDSAVVPFGFAYAAGHVARGAFDVLIPSVVLSIVLLGFRLARRPFSRFLGLIIVLGTSYIVLVNGMLWLRTVSAATPSVTAAPRQYIQPSTLVRVGTTVLAAGSVKDSTLQGIILFDTTRPDNRFSAHATATASTKAGTLTVTAGGRPPVTVTGTPALSWTGVFAADRFTSAFLRDIDTLTSDFEKLLRTSLPEFFAACLSLLFLCTASLALLRVTRWPLANIMLLVIAVRGYFSLYHLLATGLAPQVARAVADPLVSRMFPAAALAAAGVLLLLVDILFIPADRWSRQEEA